MTLKKKFISYLQMAGGMSLAGSSVVAGKLIAHRFPIFLSMGISLLLAVAVLIPLSLRHWPAIRSLRPRNLAILFLQALSGTVLFRIFLLNGLKYASAASAGLMTSTGPAVVGLLSFLFLRERLRWNKIAGILCAVIGILIINTHGFSMKPQDIAGPSWLGFLLIFGAVVGEALFTVLQKKSTQPLPPLATTTMISLFSLICFLPLSFREAVRFDFSTLGLRDMLPLIYYGVMVTAVAFILWFSGLEGTPASTAGVFFGFMPVSGLFLSCLVLKEKLEPAHLLSLGFVLAGILLMTSVAPKTPPSLSLLPRHGRRKSANSPSLK